MGTAETLVALTQGHFLGPAKRRLVKPSTSDNDAKFNSRRFRDNKKKMGLNQLSCSLTELDSKAGRIPTVVVSPSIGLHEKQNVIRKVPSQTEMWECIRTNYIFLMKDDLVMACQRTKEEMHWCEGDSTSTADRAAPKWTCTEFISKFNELHDILHQIQNQVPADEDKSSFLKSKQNQLRSLWEDCKVLKEQASLLEIRYPGMKDDISRRCNILNNKWETLQQAFWPKRQQKQKEVLAELTARMKHIRRWLREVDNKLKKLKVWPHWPLTQILEMHDRQKALQLEIETRGREVTSLLKRVAAPEGANVDSCQVLHQVVRNLERYWHTVWLQSLENHCLTEQILEQKRNAKANHLTASSDTDFDEGPRTKYRRLTQDNTVSFVEEKNPGLSMDTQSIKQDMCYQSKSTGEKSAEKSSKSTITYTNTREIGTLCSVARDSHRMSDKCIMVGTTGIAALKAKYGDDFSNFEIIQDVGYSSESSTHLSSDDVTEYIRVYSFSPPRKISIEDPMVETERNMLEDSAIPASQRVFGHNSLGSSSSHNDSGFGPSETTLCEVPRTLEVGDGNDRLKTCEWNALQDVRSDVSDSSLEEVLGFHLSFSEINDNSPMSVGFTLDGFDSDGSSDFHNRSSFTSDAQAFYKVTSIDSENGDLDSPEKEGIRCTNDNIPLGFLNASKSDIDENVKFDDNRDVQCESGDGDAAISAKLSDDGNLGHSNLAAISFRDAFKPSYPENCEWDSDVSETLFLDLDPRKNLTSSPLRSVRRLQRQQSPSNLHHQLREFPSRHTRCRSIKLDRTSIEKTCGMKTARSRRVREWLSYSCRNQNICNHVSEYSEGDSPIEDYCEDDAHLPVAMDARIDSSCDASGEYTTTTESDGDGSAASSSDDCFVSGKFIINGSAVGSVESVVPLESEVFGFGKISEGPPLLLPPPPPETPTFLAKETTDFRNSDHFHPNSESEVDSEEIGRGRSSTLRAASDGHLNMTSSSFCRTTANSSSTTVNEAATSNIRPGFPSKLFKNFEGLSSESSAAENRVPARGQRFTRSLPSVLQQDSFPSSISDNYHSYPSESARPGDSRRPSKKKQISNGHRCRKPSSSSNRSHQSGRRRRQTVSECCTRKRHWSVVQTPLQVRIAKANDSRVETAQLSPDLDRTVLASPESDLIFTAVEEQSTVSDQVWDGYQEMPYLSEAYSEPTVDEDAVRKLTEFGDDYGSAIGQSSIKGVTCNDNSVTGGPSQTAKEVKKILPKDISENSADQHDSDSDLEDLYDILTDTYKALNFAKGTYAYKKNLCNSDYAELIATCQTHLRCLKAILEHIQAGRIQENFTNNDVQLHILIKEWEVLQENLDMSKKLHSIQSDIDELRKKIFSFSIEDEAASNNFSSSKDLQKKIELMEEEYGSLMAIKDGELRTVNFRVHELAAEDDSLMHLRSEIIALYKLFQETSTVHATRQGELSKLLERWRNYCETCHDVALHIKEREDDHTFVVDEVSQKLSDDVQSLRREADFFMNKLSGSEIGTAAAKEIRTLESRLKKVALPKETHLLFPEGLPDDSESISESAYPQIASASTAEKEDENFEDALDSSDVLANDEPEEEDAAASPEKKSPPSKLWRAFRATLPIQLAVVLLYCLACAFEPSCCELINNFNFSFSPQLRYMRGPPPV